MGRRRVSPVASLQQLGKPLGLTPRDPWPFALSSSPRGVRRRPEAITLTLPADHLPPWAPE
eukprot:6778333-Alexandrium_andersonii.AAC.1